MDVLGQVTEIVQDALSSGLDRAQHILEIGVGERVCERDIPPVRW